MPTLGVFDSGFGGLTVLRALLPMLPGSHFVYLGDTARLPYGAKSAHTVARYTLSAAGFLLDLGIEMLVVACNTASALALTELQRELPIPVIGVIEPGAQAAETFQRTQPVTANGAQVLVLATDATVCSGAYTRICAAHGLIAHEKACPLLVPLVEEGWIDHPVTAEVLRIYLSEALAAAPHATTLILGCTHYPLLKPLIQRTLATLGRPLHVVDSAAATARAACALLPAPTGDSPATAAFFATDSIAKFQRLGSHFLGRPVGDVQLVDLDA